MLRSRICGGVLFVASLATGCAADVGGYEGGRSAGKADDGFPGTPVDPTELVERVTNTEAAFRALADEYPDDFESYARSAAGFRDNYDYLNAVSRAATFVDQTIDFREGRFVPPPGFAITPGRADAALNGYARAGVMQALCSLGRDAYAGVVAEDEREYVKAAVQGACEVTAVSHAGRLLALYAFDLDVSPASGTVASGVVDGGPALTADEVRGVAAILKAADADGSLARHSVDAIATALQKKVDLAREQATDMCAQAAEFAGEEPARVDECVARHDAVARRVLLSPESFIPEALRPAKLAIAPQDDEKR